MIIISISVILVLKTFCLIVETSIWESNRRGKNRTRLSISIDCFHWWRILSFLTLEILLEKFFLLIKSKPAIAVLIAICFQYPGVGNQSRKEQIFKTVRSYFTLVHFLNSTFNFCKSKIYLGGGRCFADDVLSVTGELNLFLGWGVCFANNTGCFLTAPPPKKKKNAATGHPRASSRLRINAFTQNFWVFRFI